MSQPKRYARYGSNYRVSTDVYTQLNELSAEKVEEWKKMDPQIQQDWAQLTWKVFHPYASQQVWDNTFADNMHQPHVSDLRKPAAKQDTV